MHDIKYFESNRHTTWLEAFFDLIFAVAIADVTHILSHTREGHLDPLQFWKFVLIFIPFGGFGPATRCMPIGSMPMTGSIGWQPCSSCSC
jgi:hypothetical protein